ncbi:MAG: hypothetical protein ACOVO2_12155 [Emticicia sp.]
MDIHFLSILRQKFIEKVIQDFGDSYLPIKKNDFESINLTALVGVILKKNRENIPENKLKDYLVSDQTLRRIFEERDKETSFQQATRNFLALYLGYKNYQDFLENADFTVIENKQTPNWRSIGIIFLIIGLLTMIGYVWRKKYLNGPLKGKLEIVTYENTKAPMTAKFSYNFNHLNFDKAYLDYSLWSGEKDTVELDKSKNKVSICFMHPTVRRVKLVADGKILDSLKVVVPSVGWVSGYEAINYLPSELWKKNGVAHISKEYLPKAVKDLPTYYSFVKKVSNFDRKLVGDDMIYETRFKNPVAEGGINCNDVVVGFTCENHNFAINFTQKGCSHFAYVVLGNTKVEGKTSDLSKLGINLDNYVQLKIVFKDKQVHIFIDEQLVFHSNFSEKLGLLQASYIGFKGLGSVDYIKFSKNNQVLEEENF